MSLLARMSLTLIYRMLGKMTFRATIYDASKRKIGSMTFATWTEAAKKLREDKTEGRMYSSITIEL